jgi:hypothetical protein
LVFGALAAVASAVGFLKGGAMAAAFLGYPGAIATFFFLVLARAVVLSREQVATLGTWLLYAGGALAVLGISCGLFAFLGNLRVARMALPLSIGGAVLVAIAALRLSTATGTRRGAFQGLAAGLLLLGVASALHFTKVLSALGF